MEDLFVGDEKYLLQSPVSDGKPVPVVWWRQKQSFRNQTELQNPESSFLQLFVYHYMLGATTNVIFINQKLYLHSHEGHEINKEREKWWIQGTSRRYIDTPTFSELHFRHYVPRSPWAKKLWDIHHLYIIFCLSYQRLQCLKQPHCFCPSSTSTNIKPNNIYSSNTHNHTNIVEVCRSRKKNI